MTHAENYKYLSQISCDSPEENVKIGNWIVSGYRTFATIGATLALEDDASFTM